MHQAQVLQTDGSLQLGDMLVVDRTIEAVADRIDQTADLEIDGRGLTLLPGVIDPPYH